MNYNEILAAIPAYVGNYIETQSQKVQLPYHNMRHTDGVVEATKQIANHYQLNEHDFFVVTVAAWFHDLGYYSGDDVNHESKGAEMAATFLQEKGADEKTITEVKGCINATQMPQRPTNLNEQIVCDADLFHFGTDEFSDRNKLMRKEAELKMGVDIDKKLWRAGTIKLLLSHHFHTDYARLLLDEKKQENLNSLLKKSANKEAKEVVETSEPATQIAAEPVKEKKSEKADKGDKPSRGIETMFRVAATNHQRLSDMADSKANIMISVNAIIISLVIGLVIRKIDSAQGILIPTLIMLTGSVITIIFSVLATRPKIPNGYFTPDQMQNKTVNLLFFGNFYKMDFDLYYDGMKKVMADSDFLYGSLIRDIYSQGTVLGHKYKLLRISYTIFVFMLTISVIAFAISFIFFNK